MMRGCTRLCTSLQGSLSFMHVDAALSMHFGSQSDLLIVALLTQVEARNATLRDACFVSGLKRLSLMVQIRPQPSDRPIVSQCEPSATARLPSFRRKGGVRHVQLFCGAFA